MKVPFLDLHRQYASIRREITEAIEAVVERTAFAGGPFVSQFEEHFAEFCGVRHAVGVGSGTDALWAALVVLGVGEGDEVITVPNTFIATAEAISRCGARPVFVDIDERRHTLDPERLESVITPRTKAIIPVHLFGQMADMDPILDIARERNLRVVEDACQAHGARYKGKRAGSMGDAGCFSFYPGKNLGAYGEAGAVVTNAPEIDAQIRVLRDHGQTKKYHHEMVGWNARMDGLQGAILDVKLRHLEGWTRRRREIAAEYDQLLGNLPGVQTPRELPDSRHVYHLYPVRVGHRDDVMDKMAQADVHCGIHYPVPVHLTAAYRDLGYGPGSFPVAERCAGELLSLPMFPELTPEETARTVWALKQSIE
jgi:dTDP-4-amino-4,6-dideoxygalactose transaminase